MMIRPLARCPGSARGLAAIVLAGSALAGAGCGAPAPEATEGAEPLRVGELLGGDAAGFARAIAPRPFVFPDDHGPHPAYRNEWWYLTGNLASGDERFGFQLTFFRSGLATAVPRRPSAWAVDEVFMAHFALTDVAGHRFYAHERFSRPALGLAGAELRPAGGAPELAVWVEDWRLDGGHDGAFRLVAAGDEVELELHLESVKPPVLQGDAGLSQKGPERGNASYYYSLTKMAARGTVRLPDRDRREVSGWAWMDREWSTSALSPGVVGWDWFALQLDDGRELMVYRLRRADGSAAPESSGSLVAADGAARTLSAAEVEITVLERWRSPATGVSYPARWRIALPAAGLRLTVEPLVADQELDLAVRYWEGAVRVSGPDGEPAGSGYVELTGY